MDLALGLDEKQPLPLYRQLYEGLREAILTGRLTSGQKLPSSRSLSLNLSVSRNTVSQAYEELEAEGYLSGKHGSGTYVSTELPDDAPVGRGWRVVDREGGDRGNAGVRRTEPGEREASRVAPVRAAVASLPFDFHPGQGAWDSFPWKVWRRLLGRRWKTGWQEAMDYGDPGGYQPLREEVARYLAGSRAVRCRPEDVVIVNGTQQALDLLARIVLRPGDQVAVEDPGYPAARRVFTSYGAGLLPVPVDQDGMQVGRLQGCGARMALVTPSHQFPTGTVLSLPRRFSLLAWARTEGALVLEDDYDSEFRFEGRPLASLQGLDGGGSVVYLGSFSKVLFPSLRVGYVVLPPDLVTPFEEAKELTDRQTPILEQQVLAGFLGEGHFERHLRRMRLLYQRRRLELVEALRQQMGESARVMGASAGMHLMVRLDLQATEQQIVELAAAEGVGVYPAGSYYQTMAPGPALVLGYAGMQEVQIRAGVSRLARSLAGLPRVPRPLVQM